MSKQYVLYRNVFILAGLLLFLSTFPLGAFQTKNCGKQYDENGQLLDQQDTSKWCKGSKKKRQKRIKRIAKRKEQAKKALDGESSNNQDPAENQNESNET